MIHFVFRLRITSLRQNYARQIDRLVRCLFIQIANTLRGASVRSTRQLQQFQTSPRKPRESISSCWIRFAKTDSEEKVNGVAKSPALLYRRASQAPPFTSEQKNAILGALRNSPNSNRPNELRHVDLMMFNAPFKADPYQPIDWDDGASVDTFQMGDKGANPTGQERDVTQTETRTFNYPHSYIGASAEESKSPVNGATKGGEW